MTIKRVLINFKKYSFLLKELIKRDFKIKYKRSVLGVLWSILYPLLMMSVMAIIFSNMFKFKVDNVNFSVYLMCGLVLWNYFCEATNSSLTAIVGNFSLLNKVYIPCYMKNIKRPIIPAILPAPTYSSKKNGNALRVATILSCFIKTC